MSDAQPDMTAPRDGLSHVRGADHPPLQELTIPQLLARTVAAHGDRLAAVFCDSGQRLSYRQLSAEVDRIAAGLLALGITTGDRVGIWSPNRLEWLLVQFATARIGAILVNINPAYRLSELEYALAKVGCRAIIAASRFKSSDYAGMLRELLPELGQGGAWPTPRFPHLEHVILMQDDPGPGMLSFAALAAAGQPEHHAALDAITDSLSPHDPINIQFTSGTTGRPKGATLSHFNIVNNGSLVTDRIALTQDDVLVIPVPLYHCFGMVMGVLGAVSKGAAMIFPGEAFDPAQTLAAIEAERATALYGVPTMFVAMLQELDQNPRDLSSLRTGIMAGAPCPIEVMRRVNRDMHMHEVTICYGMTETSPVSFQSFADDPTEKRCETVGRIHPHLEVRIVDAQGQTVPVGTAGEIWTRGYSVMAGYWQDPEATVGAISDGWMHTGDLGVLDEQGFCSIVGRVKDMIIRGGENIYPREIEEFLIGHPQVRDVQVFGIPDQRFGEEVCAWIVARSGEQPDPESLRAYCQGRIAHFKIPRHFRIVPELPMTITGKPQKFVMRDQMVQMLRDEGTLPGA
ncbi:MULTISPECIES: AMP-binding protein [unclassified Paracoccus (in: a-proteobacteria)]|uniref:AMP-binding protein n=1 Tax=unclassified Paracoccus (in: a-proteobacteria) TaxID=2688777 RepID=UPI0012B33FE5|nr:MULTISPECIES: AMP-binding protein [unclassified Paracoccus (in: a-proteobacteria)]UXU76433.1 AMP-binding protein [Paracoccus sp. SMMA_5]UXU82229.1 AMP-binding protein [Paracoccus sp. SMMA_5_TC]